MSLMIGDVVFSRNGEPGIIRSKDQKNGEFQVDRDFSQVQKSFRHGFLNGLNAEEKNSYLEILDKTRGQGSIANQVKFLENEINRFSHSSRKVSKSLQYLKNQLTHFRHIHHIKPRYYNMDIS